MSFDHIVVGSGSSGSAVAAGLAERPDTSVLLLEAGPKDRDPRIRMPGAASELWFGRLDWALRTEPAIGFGGRVDTWPRGRVLGGSSSINNMIYARGMPLDFDEWEAAGATGWNAASMQEAFRRLEDDVRGPAPHRGVGGQMRIEHQRDPRPLTHAFLDACEEIGLPRVDDYHVDPDGCALTMVNQRDGRRWSAADAYLRDHLGDRGSSLTIRTGIEVLRVVVEGGRAVGVEARVGGRSRFVGATRDVVLSAGAIGSPQLLLRSGIGPADDLRALGIDVVADLPGVGNNLQDHVVTGMIGETSGGSLHGADRDPRHLATWLRNGMGPVTSNLGEAIAFLRTSDDEPAPDVELIAFPAALRDHGRTRPPVHGITIGTILLRPESRGRIRLAGVAPSLPPIIDTRALEDPAGVDLRRLIAGLRVVERLLTRTRALGDVVEAVIDPPVMPTTDQGVVDHIRETAQTLYHPVGTCRMGQDADAVVDPELRVHGVAGLRVADASVMPNLIRGHTHAAAVAIGVRAVDLIGGA